MILSKGDYDNYFPSHVLLYNVILPPFLLEAGVYALHLPRFLASYGYF